MKRCGMQKTIFLVTLGAVSVLLQGCTFGSESESCDGEGCSCVLTFHSFWARIRISDVPIEHSSRTFKVPDVAKDVVNASFSPCCDAIYDQIDYDEGKPPSAPNKLVGNYNSSCGASPNKEIASLGAHPQNVSRMPSVVARQLRSSRKVGVSYEPIHDGEDGQDCEVSSNGFSLNNVTISSGGMSLKIKWVDPKFGKTPCCDALKPLLRAVYIADMKESDVPVDVRTNFCKSCKSSPNQGIALAAYKCFETPKSVNVEV